MKRLPIGISDFKKLIENDYIFADTTGLIGDVYREAADIILLTRPRRFGIKAEFSCNHGDGSFGEWSQLSSKALFSLF